MVRSVSRRRAAAPRMADVHVPPHKSGQDPRGASLGYSFAGAGGDTVRCAIRPLVPPRVRDASMVPVIAPYSFQYIKSAVSRWWAGMEGITRPLKDATL